MRVNTPKMSPQTDSASTGKKKKGGLNSTLKSLWSKVRKKLHKDTCLMFPFFVCLQHWSNSDTSHLVVQLLIKQGISQYTRSSMQGDNKKCVVFLFSDLISHWEFSLKGKYIGK